MTTRSHETATSAIDVGRDILSPALIAALAEATPVRILKQFRPPRAALVLPLARHLLGSLKDRDVLEIGSGEPLLLARALLESGARIRAIDPALGAPGLDVGRVDAIAADALAIAPESIAPAELTVSTLLFGAPLRQRAKRELRDRYLSGDLPTPEEVHAKLREVEMALVSRLAQWTQPGGWTIHISLERLFTLSEAGWRRSGFEPVLLPSAMEKPAEDDAIEWARYALSGALVARRLGQ